MSQSDKTHFGFEQVSTHEKQGRVKAVFESVASRYDVMNDLMSLGIHRLWKRLTIALAHVQPGQKVLDLAGGSGDLSQLLSKKVGKDGLVLLTDINQAMLKVGRDKMLDLGLNNIQCAQINAEALPFADNTFDCITIAFGLRNVTNKPQALQSMYQALKPGSKAIILEFSKPTHALLNKIYDFYSFNFLPLMGKWITNDADSYRYLAESIRMHPEQEQLAKLITNAGFDECQYYNLTGGIVALHIAYKY